MATTSDYAPNCKYLTATYCPYTLRSFKYKLSWCEIECWCCFFLQGLFRNFDIAFLPLFRKHLEKLVTDTSHDKREYSHRLAAEIISGLIRGSKHWDFDRVWSDSLWCLVFDKGRFVVCLIKVSKLLEFDWLRSHALQPNIWALSEFINKYFP